MVTEMPDDVFSNEPVMPEIPIKPNNAIPVTIGIIIILGSLLVLVIGAGELYTHQNERTDEYYESLASGFNQVGIETNASEVREWDQAYQDVNYHLWMGMATLLPGVGLLASGIMLCMRRRLGVWVGVGAAGFYVLVGVILNTVWASSIENDVGISMETPFATAELAIGIICSLVCLLLPFIPLFVAAGNSALLPRQETGSEEE